MIFYEPPGRPGLVSAARKIKRASIQGGEGWIEVESIEGGEETVWLSKILMVVSGPSPILDWMMDGLLTPGEAFRLECADLLKGEQ